MLVLYFGRSLATEYVPLNNKPCTTRPILADLNPDEFHYYLFMVSLGRCDWSCNTVENVFGRICVPNKIGDVNLKEFNMIKEINESNNATYFI